IVASELLDIESTGSVEGEISVRTIKTAEGSRMVGTMSTYQEEEKPKEEKPKEEKPKEEKAENA
ncbi:MAG: hypothetical protein PHO65_05900, partial [Sulfurovum sp.]|nr:hypothetical protein [Sulfurovum sp.]